MKRLLSLLLATMLCVCLAVPVPAARAEQNNVTIYSMLLFLIQGFSVQPAAAYDVTDMLTGSGYLDANQTVIAFVMSQNWIMLSGVNNAGEYTGTVFAYENDSFFMLLQAIASTYENLLQMTTREGETLSIEVTFSEGTTYVFDSTEDVQILLQLFSEE